MQILLKEHITSRNPPKNLQQNDVLLFQHEFTKYIKACTLEQLKNIEIHENIFFEKRKLKFQVDIFSTKISIKNKLKRLKLLLSPVKKIDNGIWIIDSVSFNFFHWFTDALPRLLAANIFLDNHLILLPIDYKKYAYISQSLDIIGKKTFFFNQWNRTHIKNLLIPDYTAPSGNYNKRLINQLRYEFTKDNTSAISRKVYISRQSASRRTITNEGCVIDLLLRYKFEMHCFEDYSLYDQIKLAQTTKILVGIHGAGLTNMLFMPKKGKILELRNKNDNHNNCYFSLASDLDHDYYYLQCKGDSDCTQDANLSVNVKDLKKVLDQLFSEI